MDNPAKIDITIYKNRDFSKKYACQNEDGSAFDLTGFLAESEMREARKVGAQTIAAFAISPATLGTAGTLFLTLAASANTGLTQLEGEYDIKFTSPAGVKESWAYGRAFLKETVTD